jgi:hypothetical protein
MTTTIPSAPPTTRAAAVVDFVRNQGPLWPMQLLLVCVGNPVVFLVYFIVTANSTGQDGIKILGMPTFTRAGDDGSNTSRMNVLLFVVIVTLPLYLMWFAWQVFGVIPVSVRAMARDSTTIRTFHVAAFASHYGNMAACGWALPGLLNVVAWSTEGMEGNVMGMVVLPVLLVSAVAYGVLWFACVRDALEEPVGAVVGYHVDRNDDNNDDPKNSGGSRAALPAVS